MTQVTATTVEGAVLFSPGMRLLPSEAKYIRGLGRFSTVGTLYGMGISGMNMYDSLTRFRPINKWDAADFFAGGATIVATVFLAGTPVGWVMAVGGVLYFTGREIYNQSNK